MVKYLNPGKFILRFFIDLFYSFLSIGKAGEKEVDFIAISPEEKIYYQVTETMSGERTRERELEPLRSINDNYEKVVLNSPYQKHEAPFNESSFLIYVVFYLFSSALVLPPQVRILPAGMDDLQ